MNFDLPYILCLPHTGEKCEYNGTIHQLFIDFTKVYDSVRRYVLCNILTEFHKPMGLVRIIKMGIHKTYSKDHTVKHFSDEFPIQNGLKQDALSPLFFNCGLVYTIRKFQENKEGLELNGIKHVPYFHEVHLNIILHLTHNSFVHMCMFVYEQNILYPLLHRITLQLTTQNSFIYFTLIYHMDQMLLPFCIPCWNLSHRPCLWTSLRSLPQIKFFHLVTPSTLQSTHLLMF
jgi:hypothetical protein